MTPRRVALAAGLAIGLAAARPVAAEPPRPAPLVGVGLEPRLGQRIPRDLLFTEAGGRRTRLGQLLDKRPVLLILAYVRCQMLCSLVLRGAVEAVRAMPLEPGRDYRIVTVSLDPHEEAAAALARRAELVREIGHPGQPDRWTYLVGAERPIRALADAIGFRYAWDPRSEQYAHPAAVFVLAPDGTLAAALEGIQFAPSELADALGAAAAGRVTSASVAEAVLSCFRFDPAARARRDQIERYLKVGGAAISLGLGSSVVGLFLWERRRRRRP